MKSSRLEEEKKEASLYEFFIEILKKVVSLI